ncbi:hypothetical protein F5883DRAFT_524408 [Diaporthe sp. PMI_573]|nr:hypothetical protein F5883DRAFT_524408 [Diaporthaceae sp. PMI_573]
MPAFSSHHCPKCGRVGNKRCLANGHYKDCEIHPGSFHSVYTECVKCANLKQLEEQEARAAIEKMKEEEDENKSQRKKKAKTPKAKPDCEKSMKQLRKEKKERRRTGGSDIVSPCAAEKLRLTRASAKHRSISDMRASRKDHVYERRHPYGEFLDILDTWDDSLSKVT